MDYGNDVKVVGVAKSVKGVVSLLRFAGGNVKLCSLKHEIEISIKQYHKQDLT
jgi:hypothetical protein